MVYFLCSCSSNLFFGRIPQYIWTFAFWHVCNIGALKSRNFLNQYIFFSGVPIDFYIFSSLAQIQDCSLTLLKCFVQMSLEEENTKAFLILNEIILTLKNVRATCRILIWLPHFLANHSIHTIYHNKKTKKFSACPSSCSPWWINCILWKSSW